MFCQYSRGGEKESAGEVAESERERERQTDENDKTQPNGYLLPPDILHKLQEVNYFAEKVKRELTCLRLTSDVQYQHGSTFLLLVRKCDIAL